MRIIERSELKLGKRGKSFCDLVNEEKVQDLIDNFCHAYSSFYDSDLVKRWCKATSPISRKKEIEYFIGIFKYYYQICKKNLTQIKSIYYKKRERYDSSIPKIIDNAVCGYTARS